jgi:hypothetical protein
LPTAGIGVPAVEKYWFNALMRNGDEGLFSDALS